MQRTLTLLACLVGACALRPVGSSSLRLSRKTITPVLLPRLLLPRIRGGNWEDDEDDEDDDETKDRYRDLPPPDELRYTHGVRTAKSGRDNILLENMTKSSDTESSTDEPAWVDGQIKQGGKKLKYNYGRCNYYKDVANISDPWEQFEPDLLKGQTYADFMFARERFDNVNLAEQHGPYMDRMRRVIASGHTTPAGYGAGGILSANFSFQYPEDRYAILYPNLTGNVTEIPFFEHER